MSNYLNYSITTRNGIKDWALRRLGYPLVQVEITEAQLDDAINEATEEFTKYVINEEQYLAYDLSTYQSSGYTLPSTVAGVFAIEESSMGSNTIGGINTLFSLSNEMWNVGVMPPFMAPGGGQTAWILMGFSQKIHRTY